MSPGVRSGGRQVGQGENQEEDKKRRMASQSHEDKFHLVLPRTLTSEPASTRRAIALITPTPSRRRMS